jgi:hypothetical protein
MTDFFLIVMIAYIKMTAFLFPHETSLVKMIFASLCGLSNIRCDSYLTFPFSLLLAAQRIFALYIVIQMPTSLSVLQQQQKFSDLLFQRRQVLKLRSLTIASATSSRTSKDLIGRFQQFTTKMRICYILKSYFHSWSPIKYLKGVRSFAERSPLSFTSFTFRRHIQIYCHLITYSTYISANFRF